MEKKESAITDMVHERGGEINKKPIYETKGKVAVYKVLLGGREEFVLKINKRKGKINHDLDDEKFNMAKKLGEENPHFIKAIDIVHTEDEVGKLLEYGGQDLLTQMNEATKEDIIMWMKQSTEAFIYFQTRRCANFDIKPENMVFKDGILKIIDLDSSQVFSTESKINQSVYRDDNVVTECTRSYAPPEILIKTDDPDYDPNKLKGAKFDIYCWGMSFFQLITKRPLKEFEKLIEIRKTKVESQYKKEFLKKVVIGSEALKEYDPKITKILSKCLKFNLQKRGSFSEVFAMLQLVKGKEYLSEDISAQCHMQIGKSYLNHTYCYDEAIRCLDQSIKERHESLKKNSVDDITCNNCLGIAYQRMGKNGDALEIFLKALDIAKDLKKEDEPEIGKIHCNIGNIYFSKNEHEKALNKYVEALDLLEKAGDKYLIEIAQINDNIASLKAQNEELDFARNYHKSALKTLEKLLTDDPRIATAKHNFAYTYLLSEDLDNAREYFQEASETLKIRINLGDRHPDIASCFNGLGAVCEEDKKYSEAKKHYTEALKMWKETMSSNPNIEIAEKSLKRVEDLIKSPPK